MEIIRVSRIADFGGANRRYYDVGDIRILDVHHVGEPDESWHYHDEITEALFVIEGRLRIKTKNEEVCVEPNQIVKFSPKEPHQVLPLTPSTRILVVKYKSRDENLISVISKDWQDFT